MKKYFITGATGFIGSHLVEALPQNRVCTFDRNVDLSIPIPHSAYPYEHDVDTIIHLANPRNFKNFPVSSKDVFNVNVTTTLSLLEYARKNGVKTFMLASTGGIGYDNNFYTTSKKCAELISSHYSEYMTIIVLSFYFVYGPMQDERRLIPTIINSVRSGKAIHLDGYYGIRVNPIYITDAVNTIIEILKLHRNGKFDICGNEVLSIREISNIVGECVGKEPTFDVINPKTKNSIIGNNFVSKEIYTPKISFRDGILKILEQS